MCGIKLLRSNVELKTLWFIIGENGTISGVVHTVINEPLKCDYLFEETSTKSHSWVCK